jgi:hypothetical protein
MGCCWLLCAWIHQVPGAAVNSYRIDQISPDPVALRGITQVSNSFCDALPTPSTPSILKLMKIPEFSLSEDGETAYARGLNLCTLPLYLIMLGLYDALGISDIPVMGTRCRIPDRSRSHLI